jgi:hypothetical protein
MNTSYTTLLASLTLALSGAASAQTAWDAAGDFSLALNPNAAWSYNWQMPGGPLNLMGVAETDCGVPGLSCWNLYGGIWALPQVGINSTARAIEYASVVIPVQVLNLEPGSNGERAVVTWTADSAGRYVTTGQFQLVDRLATGVQVMVSVDGAEVLSQPMTAFGQAVQFNFKSKLSAGQTISFVVDAAGEYGHDLTELSAGILRLK